jgi:hypothetical protein
MAISSSRLLPRHRRTVIDLCRAARSVPAFAVERSWDARRMEALRKNASSRISWPCIFLRAWGLVGQQVPTLRQAYLSFPRPRLYQHPVTIGTIAMHRPLENEEQGQLIWPRIASPESKSLVEIQEILDQAKTAPLASIGKDIQLLARFPAPIRHLSWWLLMHLWGRKKAKKLGTFGLSTLASQGSLNRSHPLVLTSSLTYGPIDDRGQMLVTVLCDHRVIDGYLASQALAEMLRVMEGTIADELLAIQSPPAQTPP